MLTIKTPAESYDLVRLDDVRAQLGITDRSEDENLAAWIASASAAVARFCNRTFARETLVETFRLTSNAEALFLARYPVVSVASVTEYDAIVDPADYEVDTRTGELTRLRSDDPVSWSAGKITVEYVAGFALDDLPADVARAVVLTVGQYRAGTERDPQLRSETTDGAGSSSYFDGLDAGGGLSPEVRGLLADHRKPAGC